MLTVGGTALLALGFGLDVHHPHQTLHTFVVNEPFLTPQLRCNATIAVRRPLSSHSLDGRLEFRLVRSLSGSVVVAAPGTAKHIASQADGIILGEHIGWVAKISGARSRSSSLQRERTCGLSRYSRQISALSLTPVSSSSTARALNSGVNVRCFDIVFPLSWTNST